MSDEDQGQCFFCNGFYGPTHGEYVCDTCHLFLYSDVHHRDFESNSGVADENDSGNDEPSEGQLTTDRCMRPSISSNHVHPVGESSNSSSAQRSLIHRVIELSVSSNNVSVSNSVAAAENEKLEDEVEEELNDNLAKLPPEILLMIFHHLDMFSLWSLSTACTYLSHLIEVSRSDCEWKKSVQKYWPLYRPIYNDNWFNIFSKLIQSVPCKSCLSTMMNDVDCKCKSNVALNEIDCVDNSRRLQFLGLDYDNLQNEPPEGVNAEPMDRNLLHWCATIEGPINSPYEGGIFFLYIQFPYVYPLEPPKVRFITKIFHPNVSRHGDIGLDCISHNWNLVLTIHKILISIQSLLTDPYCKVCMEPNIAKLYDTDRDLFNLKATKWTYKYAMTDILPLWSEVHDDDCD